MSTVTQKVCLIVIDGWGLTENQNGNAIYHAKTPVMDRLIATNCMPIEAHGLHVGLPEGLMGNSEVGHLNIGAGRVVYQDIVRINMAVKKDQLKTNSFFVAACKNAIEKSDGRLHLLGLISDGGVHSHIDHLFGLLKAAKELGVKKCFVHFFGDGRDTSPTSGAGYMKQLLDFMKKIEFGELADVVGRYYAMDRDKRWERIQVAYEMLVGGRGEECPAERVIPLIIRRYEAEPAETDEFLKPIIVSKDGRVKENDTLVFFNYRSDRMREIVETMGIKRNISSTFYTAPHPANLHITCMTRYNESFSFPVLFPPETNKNVLAEWLAHKGLTQYHCAETEKYAHVTFFFNGGQERIFDKEVRQLVPSPKVATYDLLPPMSSAGVADEMVKTIASKVHPFVMCNFAPPDMVGHTGVYEAAIIACEATDLAIGRVEQACKENGYVLMVTSDHGNAEQMYDERGLPHTAHTCNPVPFISTGPVKIAKKPDGREPALCDVAVTVLDQMGLDFPAEMGGASLLQK